jgi:WD40 repeat protein
MLTSLAFAASTASDEAEREGGGGGGGSRVAGGSSPSSCRPVVACGMESGHVLLYDLAQSSASLSVEGSQQPMASSSSSSSPTLWLEEPAAEISLGKDPVMALDMVPSRPPSSSPPPGLAGVAVAAGLAGTPEDVAALDPADRGRVALLRFARRDGAWSARIRSRFATCKLPASPAGAAAGGKPGVSLCRFRPGAGRLVAVAGWDRRVRVFDRSSPGPSAADPLLALLRGHAATVTALDWAADAEASGLVATGGGDGRINVWKLDL